MKSECIVSVIMPVYNGERYISQAIESILNQTLSGFELIVVNDGSTDSTREILSKYSSIRVINQENQGVAVASNNGIAVAKGKYIARLDADDIAFTDRLEKQINVLEMNPKIGILGSSAIIINSDNRNWGRQKMPSTDSEIRWMSLFKSPFIHSSVVFRNELIEGILQVYDQKFAPSDDYDLWVRLLQNTRGTNLLEPTVKYRVHPTNATSIQHSRMLEKTHQISNSAFNVILPQAKEQFSADELYLLQNLLYSSTREYLSFSEDRTRLILDYLMIWDLFKEEYSSSIEDIPTIQKQVIVKACQMTFFPSITRDSNEIVRILNAIDRKWPLIFLNSMPYATRALMRERFLRKV